MTVKDIVTAYLKANGFDGLYCEDNPCGCLVDPEKGGLTPCEENWTDCKPGVREDVGADDECGCDDMGTPHWHVVPPPALDHLADAPNWLCDCGQRVSNDGTWRWSGQGWEHCHGYPIGHVAATRTPEGKIVTILSEALGIGEDKP